jgi:hypothetical protein
MKHIAKMKNNSARVVVAYRTIPGDGSSALVVGTQGLPDAYHDSLMQLVQEDAGQQANELADVLAVRKFPDGTNMLEFLHTRGHLKKVPTSLVLMTPNTQTTLPLDELNKMIAEQKGVSVDNLAVTEDASKSIPTKKSNDPTEIIVDEVPVIAQPAATPTPATLRSKADELLAEAKALRELADSLDKPKAKAASKTKKVSATV